VQVFQHFEKITLLLYNKVLKLGKPVSINIAVKLSKRLKPIRYFVLFVFMDNFINCDINKIIISAKGRRLCFYLCPCFFSFASVIMGN